jgi:hypothetical protein
VSCGVPLATSPIAKLVGTTQSVRGGGCMARGRERR